MSMTAVAQPHHLRRKAVIYIRQSTGHQVLTNIESQQLQHAMREHARQLGWPEELIEVVESDLGRSAQSTERRDGYKALLAEVALGQVGIVLSYESTRLSRNCTDWYPLLDLCAYNQCLIADRDGVYDAATPNGRLLLGMKGIVSEVELHTLRGRLIAGVQQKAQRGDLALALPAGLLRQDDGVAVQDPDRAVQHAITLVFQTFLERRSASQVVRLLREQGLRLPRRHRNCATVWRTPTVAAVIAILRNPAYAGTFVYGKTQTQVPAGGGRPQQRRLPLPEWKVIVHDRYPAYVTWETFARIQALLNDNYATYAHNKRRGIPRQGAALLQGLVYCARCGHKMAVQYKGGNQYLCNYLRSQAQAPVCQRLRADPVDQQVVAAFFDALAPAEIDLYDHVMEQRRQQQREVNRAQHYTLQRLEHAAEQARRRYEQVDPTYRLVAAELERRWEAALQALQEAQEQYTRLQHKPEEDAVNLTIPADLREAFSALGQSLPTLWRQETLSRVQRKALLRCLIDKVVLDRRAPDTIDTRIVWRGGAVSEFVVPCNVGRLVDLSDSAQLEAQILRLESQGKADEDIAQLLTAKGFRSSQHPALLASTVKLIRLRHGRLHRYRGPRPHRVAGALTVPQIATAVGVKPHWIYHLISRGRIVVQRDEATGLYLFPDSAETLEGFRQLRDGRVSELRY
jgi:DNA invertase Pin-like site-specific DNA recombinase